MLPDDTLPSNDGNSIRFNYYTINIAEKVVVQEEDSGGAGRGQEVAGV